MSAPCFAADNSFRCRVHAGAEERTLIYLPGLHGDWTLLGPFRSALGPAARLLEFTYPRRTDWSLDDYADAVLDELAKLDIRHGWLLAESFSSQVGWALVGRLEHRGDAAFRLEGVILAGGFVRHPVPPGVRLAYWTSRKIPVWLLEKLCASYGRWARRRSRDCAEGLAEIEQFVKRRSSESDRAAINSRYRLIRDNDLRPLALRCSIPVYLLTGALDPIVPWPFILPWLRKHCPGFRGHRILWRSGHNVLLDGAAESARQILQWMKEGDCEPQLVTGSSRDKSAGGSSSSQRRPV